MKNDCAQKLTISATYLCACHCGLSTGAQKQKLEKRFQKNLMSKYHIFRISVDKHGLFERYYLKILH